MFIWKQIGPERYFLPLRSLWCRTYYRNESQISWNELMFGKIKRVIADADWGYPTSSTEAVSQPIQLQRQQAVTRHWQELTGQQEHAPANGKLKPTLGGPHFCGGQQGHRLNLSGRDKWENTKGLKMALTLVLASHSSECGAASCRWRES